MKFLIEHESIIGNRITEGYKKSDILTFNFLHEFVDFIKKNYPDAIIRLGAEHAITKKLCPFDYDFVLTIEKD